MPGTVAPAAWKAIFDENPDPCFLYEVGAAPRFKLAAVNAAWLESTGLSADVVGRTLAELMPPELAAVTAERFERCVAEREPASFDEELPYGGHPRHWRTTISPIELDGAIRYVLGFGHDYTDLRHTTNALAESEAKFRRLVENASDVIYRMRFVPSLALDYISPSIEGVIGYSADDFYSDPTLLQRLIHPDDLQLMGPLHDSQEPTPRLSRWQHKDGSWRWIEARSTNVTDEHGTIMAREGIARDVTEQRRRDEERAQLERRLQQTQKLESLGILAGGIAHDFNNLLPGILGHAGLIRMSSSCSPELSEHAHHVELAAMRAADLCWQMLAYSGKGRFAVQRLELDALVHETTQLLELSIAKTTTLALDLHADRAVVEADASQLQQVVMNLVLNASEACAGRPGLVRVATSVVQVTRDELREAYFAPDLPGGSYVAFEVTDDGEGMSPETLARIFDPFFTTKFTGRGLGLSAVLGIVRGHSGAIRVESQPGLGTRFRVLFPRVEGEPTSVQSSRRPRQLRGSGRILVVDDEVIVRDVTARLLQALGYTVLTAGDGEEGVRAFQASREPIDAVLMDLTMPRLDGVGAFEQLRRLDAKVPVLLMSGYSEQDASARFAGRGLSGFVQKPFSTEQLAAKLGNALRRR